MTGKENKEQQKEKKSIKEKENERVKNIVLTYLVNEKKRRSAVEEKK